LLFLELIPDIYWRNIKNMKDSFIQNDDPYEESEGGFKEISTSRRIYKEEVSHVILCTFFGS